MSKILLVDDDPDVLHIMSLLLRKEGYDIATASRREEVLEKLMHETPSLILMDVLLSGTDGRELCREIKAAEKTKDVPILMFSGHPGAAFQFEAYGAAGFIAKPINTSSLLEKLSEQMNVVK